jgi:hypothetical protein
VAVGELLKQPEMMNLLEFYVLLKAYANQAASKQAI